MVNAASDQYELHLDPFIILSRDIKSMQLHLQKQARCTNAALAFIELLQEKYDISKSLFCFVL